LGLNGAQSGFSSAMPIAAAVKQMVAAAAISFFTFILSYGYLDALPPLLRRLRHIEALPPSADTLGDGMPLLVHARDQRQTGCARWGMRVTTLGTHLLSPFPWRSS
jgi:hypothetical protein